MSKHTQRVFLVLTTIFLIWLGMVSMTAYQTVNDTDYMPPKRWDYKLSILSEYSAEEYVLYLGESGQCYLYSNRARHSLLSSVKCSDFTDKPTKETSHDSNRITL